MDPPPVESTATLSSRWLHPNQVMQLQRLKLKKKALQARINRSSCSNQPQTNYNVVDNTAICEAVKRKNPFIKNSENKRAKLHISSTVLEESSDQTLFKLLHLSNSSTTSESAITSFSGALEKLQEPNKVKEVVKIQGETWIPIDWALKTKVRFISPKRFVWNQILKLSEEASGVTSFTRCLDDNSTTSLDVSPNAKFHQCCLYWQHPVLPWLKLFPRSAGRASSTNTSIMTTPAFRDSLHLAWVDSLRSLYHLVRARQCPYFYVCANNFTVLFRAVGICGFSEIHVLVTPTTRGFRHILRQEEIEFFMPLKLNRRESETEDTLDCTQFGEEVEDVIDEEEEESPDEQWLQSMGINAEDIKNINYTQAKITHKAECKVDNSEQSLILIKGMEVNAFYNFLLNCKSAVATTGPLAGIPPTLLAPVAFNGATLTSLKVRENKVHVDNSDYYSLELSGPILPHTIHNLFAIHSSSHSVTATFANISSTTPFSKVKPSSDDKSTVFFRENLSDCGLNSVILKHFCDLPPEQLSNVECIKYSEETKAYTWT